MDYVKKLTTALIEKILSKGVRDMPQNPAAQGYDERQIRAYYYIPEKEILNVIKELEESLFSIFPYVVDKYDAKNPPKEITFEVDGLKTAPALYFNFEHTVEDFTESKEAITKQGWLLPIVIGDVQTEIFITADKIYTRKIENSKPTDFINILTSDYVNLREQIFKKYEGWIHRDDLVGDLPNQADRLSTGHSIVNNTTENAPIPFVDTKNDNKVLVSSAFVYNPHTNELIVPKILIDENGMVGEYNVVCKKYVDDKIKEIIGPDSDSALDTLKEIQSFLEGNEDISNNLFVLLSKKVSKDVSLHAKVYGTDNEGKEVVYAVGDSATNIPTRNERNCLYSEDPVEDTDTVNKRFVVKTLPTVTRLI